MNMPAPHQPFNPPAPPAVSVENLTERQRMIYQARSTLKSTVDGLMAARNCSLQAVLEFLADGLADGSLPDHIARLVLAARDERGIAGTGLVSASSMRRWINGELPTPKKAVDRNMPQWFGTFLTFYQQPQKPSIEAAFRNFKRANPSELASLSKARYWLDRMGNISRVTGRVGSRELKNSLPFTRRDTSGMVPNAEWQADGHTLDAEIAHPLHGKPFRPELTSFIDVATRKLVGWSVGLAESRFVVLEALTHAISRNGVPQILYVDNGKGYKNRMLKDEVTGILPGLGIQVIHAAPYNSQAKGMIERSHQTIWVQGAKNLPTFMGADMDDQARQAVFKATRKAIDQKRLSPLLMPWHLFIDWATAQVDDYNNRPHRSLGGRSPNQVWDESVAGGCPIRRLSPLEQQTLYRPSELRKVDRCEINLFSNIYFAQELEEFHDEIVRVAYDIHDPQFVWVMADDGRLICRAEVNGNKRSYRPLSLVEQESSKRTNGRLKRLDRKRDEVLDERDGKMIEYVPPAPAKIGNKPPKLTLLQEITAIQAEVAAVTLPPPMPESHIAPPPVKSRSQMTAAERFAIWCDQEQRLVEGGELTEDERYLHQVYQSTAEYKSQSKMVQKSETRMVEMRATA
ncbi:MAG: Mu transposase C-terminal domain-containing protein [Candidatus Pacebacteria bacterium]|nr:Mu transposase C-terminal domain-containing protein [Candidatus Paceibacterota bacterium]